MRHSLGDEVRVLTVDIFGTAVDWRSGVAEQVASLAAERGVELDANLRSRFGQEPRSDCRSCGIGAA